MKFSHALFKIIPVTASLLTIPAWSATLCVATGNQPGCYHRIGTAVAAAAPGDTILVSPGEYYEGVTITKPLSLVGVNATINASGNDRGIFIDGMQSPGLKMVHISGFIIENARLEGILALNVSSVTLGNNIVRSNNQALVAGNCSDLPAFEPGEAQDCGEGIHLQAVDHSIVTGNTVHANSGGILISDDTGTSHDNLVSFNTVTDNPFACGINMASHPPAPSTGAKAPFGVFHNTIYKNESMGNGLKVGGGAGIGIFASVPGAQSYGNVVVENTLSGNGHPGISLHAHVPGQVVDDNMIVGNIISGNGADTADAITPGPTGINLYAAGPITGNIVSGNTISNETYDVTPNLPAFVQVEFNSLLGKKTGVDNLGAGTVDATNNWWGCIAGPVAGSACSQSVGKNVHDYPWLFALPTQ